MWITMLKNLLISCSLYISAHIAGIGGVDIINKLIWF